MKMLKNGSVDPQVKLDENGKQGSTFDARGSGRQCVPQQVCRACRVEQADDFIEPHAVTDKVKDLAMAGLKKAGLKVVGSIKAEVIEDGSVRPALLCHRFPGHHLEDGAVECWPTPSREVVVVCGVGWSTVAFGGFVFGGVCVRLLVVCCAGGGAFSFVWC